MAQALNARAARRDGRRPDRASSWARTSARSAASSGSPTGSPRSSARTAAPTRRWPRRASSAPPSAWPCTGCGRSSRCSSTRSPTRRSSSSSRTWRRCATARAGAMPLPITIRVPYGGGIGGVEHHSDSSEAYYMATPGLHVVTPATVADAYGLLREAIASDDPVVFLEPKRLYWSKVAGTPSARGRRADRPRRGAARRRADATLITYGPVRARSAWRPPRRPRRRAGTSRSSTCARWCPSTTRRSCASVRRTGRAVVVHEAAGLRAAPAAEIAARVTERCFHHLEAPVLRVTGLRHPLSAADAGAPPPAGRGPDPGRGRPAAVGRRERHRWEGGVSGREFTPARPGRGAHRGGDRRAGWWRSATSSRWTSRWSRSRRPRRWWRCPARTAGR